ncbi:MAG: MFS transporter, partial [Thermomicrobiales bacterium]
GSLIMANAMTGARELFHDSVWRNRAIGFIVTATTASFTFGLPVITQIDAHFGWRVALGSLTIPLVILMAGTLILPAAIQRIGEKTAKSSAISSFREVLSDRRTRSLLIVLGLNVGTYTGWLVYFGAYVSDVFAASAGVLSIMFFLSGITEIVANNLTPPLLRRFDSHALLFTALALVSLPLLLTGIVITSIPGALITAVIVLNGTAVAYIAATALLLSDSVSKPGATMSLSSAVIGIGNAFGPLVAGFTLASTGSFEAAYRALGLFAPAAIVALWLGTRRTAPIAIPEQTR